jgi:hypothetical protein
MCVFFFNLDSDPIERTSNSELTKVTKVPTSPTRHYASVSSSTPPPESESLSQPRICCKFPHSEDDQAQCAVSACTSCALIFLFGRRQLGTHIIYLLIAKRIRAILAPEGLNGPVLCCHVCLLGHIFFSTNTVADLCCHPPCETMLSRGCRSFGLDCSFPRAACCIYGPLPIKKTKNILRPHPSTPVRFVGLLWLKVLFTNLL